MVMVLLPLGYSTSIKVDELKFVIRTMSRGRATEPGKTTGT